MVIIQVFRMPRFPDFKFIILYILSTVFAFAQSPAPLFHLDASLGVTNSNGKVKEWLDPQRNVKATQNTAANQAEYIAQSIGGRPAVRFNGASTFMNMPSIFPVDKDYTIIVVCKANGPSNNILGGNSHTLWMAGATSPKILHNGDFNNQVSTSFDPGYESTIIIAQYNNTTQKGSLILNGLYEDSSFCPKNLDNTIFISAYQGGYYFNGDISEIQLYDRYLDIAERKKIEADLKLKYKIKDPPPPDTRFTNIPGNFHFFPRDSNGEAHFEIRGNIDNPVYDSIQLLVYREQALISEITNALVYDLNQKAPFLFTAKIKSELANYAIEVKLKNSTEDTLIARRDHLVAGDVYIITGQSNSIFGGNPYTNLYCRTFGKNYSSSKADTQWTIASAAGYGGGPDICAWGMDLAKSIISEYKVPVCILNGGVGGTSIQQHQRDDINPALPVNIYGSLLYRAQKSNLASAAKAIFWYQGESNASAFYFDNFKTLYDDWKIDYPNVKKIFVVQIHQGCGAGDHAAVREIQRSLPETFTDIEVISTMGLPGHDGCHYTLDGYLALAKNIFPLVQKEFYNGIDQADFYAPNIKQAYFSKQDYSEITLVFQKDSATLLPPKVSILNGTTISLKDYFALEDQWKVIKNIQVKGNAVVLELKKPGIVNTITYLPEVNYHDFNTVYQGPYLLNKNQIGALSFYRFPIDKQMPTASNPIAEIKEIPIWVYPNPGKKSMPLYFVSNFEEPLEDIEICFRNMIGEIIFKKRLPFLPAGKNTIEIEFQIELAETLIWQFKSGSFFKAGKWVVL